MSSSGRKKQTQSGSRSAYCDKKCAFTRRIPPRSNVARQQRLTFSRVFSVGCMTPLHLKISQCRHILPQKTLVKAEARVG
jgi:hypothetical protein